MKEEAKEKIKPKTKKKKKRVVILSVLLLLVIGIGILLWTQANNLKALQYASYTPEKRQDIIEQHYAKIDEMVLGLGLAPLTPLTREQEEQLQRGEITEEEALEIVLSSAKNTEATTGTGTEDAATEAGTGGSTLQELLGRVYVLRSSYTGQLYGLIGQAKAEYIAQVKANGSADKAAIAASYIGQGLALEGACDGQMESLLSEISAELQRTGGDTSIVSEIRSAYSAEKSAVKASLLGQL